MMELNIRPLQLCEVKDFSELLENDNDEYKRFFVPFDADQEKLHILLREVQKDKYWGIWVDNKLAGFFMLRGFDEGYLRPSFGVYIAKEFSGKSLSKLALDYSLSWCRVNNIETVMLKVHPKNQFARRVYEKAGFKFIEICPKTGHDIMEKHWRD